MSKDESDVALPRVSPQRDELLALAARCEAEEPSTTLDMAINAAINGRELPTLMYSFSLDAAVTLVPTDMKWSVGSHGLRSLSHSAQVAWDGYTGQCLSLPRIEGRTPALALCAAALRARAALAEDDGRGSEQRERVASSNSTPRTTP